MGMDRGWVGGNAECLGWKEVGAVCVLSLSMLFYAPIPSIIMVMKSGWDGGWDDQAERISLTYHHRDNVCPSLPSISTTIMTMCALPCVAIMIMLCFWFDVDLMLISC
jgi:hypothetical protein